jgi:ABC-type uncharacterized transport system ATPase subunit
MKAGLL